MALVFQFIGILVVSLHLVATGEICSPCVYGILTKPNHAERSCDHAVPVDSITSSLNTTINKFNVLVQSIEKQMNIIDIADVGANQNQIAFVPLKVNKKISFVHETYYILIIVEDLITSVLRTFSYNDLDLSVRPVLCFLYQVNAKLQCKKIKKNKRWTDFQRSGACKVKNDITDKNLDEMYPKELQSLIHAKSAAAIVKETLEFWKNCVVENRRHRLMVARKCEKDNPKIAYMYKLFKMGIKGEWEFKLKSK